MGKTKAVDGGVDGPAQVLVRALGAGGRAAASRRCAAALSWAAQSWSRSPLRTLKSLMAMGSGAPRGRQCTGQGRSIRSGRTRRGDRQAVAPAWYADGSSGRLECVVGGLERGGVQPLHLAIQPTRPVIDGAGRPGRGEAPQEFSRLREGAGVEREPANHLGTIR